jgi:hypothetical protein
LAAADAGGFNNSVAEQQVGGTVFFRNLNKNVFERSSFCNHKSLRTSIMILSSDTLDYKEVVEFITLLFIQISIQNHGLIKAKLRSQWPQL